MGPSTREYGTCGARIGLARRGARALLDCHDGKDDGCARHAWRCTVFDGNKIEKHFCDLIFISPLVWQVLPDLSTMVLPQDGVSLYFISVETRAESLYGKVSFVAGLSLKIYV